jgi:Ca2+-binding EF-hand superfamily protein
MDGDGLISRQELGMVVRALGKNPTVAELNAFFKELGETQMTADFATFKQAFGKPYKTPFEQDKDMREAFKVLDQEGDGTIAESELRQVLLTVGEAMTHTEVDSLLADVPVGADGKIQYDKFVDLLVNGCPPGQDSF